MEKKLERAKYGAEALAGLKGKLPTPFPRIMGPNALKYLQEVVDSGLTVDMIGRFERAYAEAMGVKHCVSAPGCTSAIQMLAEALNFNPGDEVIFSPITDYGTIMGFIKNNNIPVFADTEPGSVNVSAKTIEPCITDRTRAIVVVHMTGIICDMDPILELAKKYNLMVIEDACQAVYGRYKGKLAGTIGDVGAFSFDAEKTMGSDIGGCFITNNDELAEYARFRCQSRGAQIKPGFGRLHVVPGSAIRMPNCTAAINLAQLEIIQENVAKRDKMVRLINKKLADIPGIIPDKIPDYLDVYSCWMCGFSIDPEAFDCTADKFGEECAAAGIPGISTARYYFMPDACTFLQENASNKVYPYSMPPASYEYNYKSMCPNAAAFLENWLRWSTFCEKYTEEDCELVAQIVKSVAEKHRR
ncbi:MAG: aminotransferase class V-fold PLP-dependent enzyme [Firmicutes bacterium]|nr:aminotransferase class V-fold PLP-dependent enzyme [Bacillota bacterium]